MKRILGLLLFISQFVFAQHNVALLHVEPRLDNAVPPTAAYSEIPFQMAGGMIVVQASVNGETGNFILDTGAPGIVLDAKNEAFVANCKGGSVNGTLNVGQVLVNDFQLGIIHEEKTQGNLLDVHHLELACGMDIMGLIGYEVLKGYEVVFDFPNHKIQAFKSGTTRASKQKPTLALPFMLCGHVPVIVGRVGGKRVFLGLDSGAGVNVLDRKFFKKIKAANRSNIKQELLTGLENMPNQVMAADVNETKLRSTSLPPMRYVFTDLGGLRDNFGVTIDGLLGIPFFKDKVVSIDYGQKKVFIWQ
jgi:hypothetical protein